MNRNRLIVFYSQQELNFKDVDHELFTEAKEVFHLFLFNNSNMHSSKVNILKDVLNDYFSKLPAQFEFDLESQSLIMEKRIENFNFNQFDALVDREYEDYINKINYRIDCIFQTFNLFLELYKNKHLVFILPGQLYHLFKKMVAAKNIRLENISKIDPLVRKFDLIHWINYYSKKEITPDNEQEISYKNITQIFKILPDE